MRGLERQMGNSGAASVGRLHTFASPHCTHIWTLAPLSWQFSCRLATTSVLFNPPFPLSDGWWGSRLFILPWIYWVASLQAWVSPSVKWPQGLCGHSRWCKIKQTCSLFSPINMGKLWSQAELALSPSLVTYWLHGLGWVTSLRLGLHLCKLGGTALSEGLCHLEVSLFHLLWLRGLLGKLPATQAQAPPVSTKDDPCAARQWAARFYRNLDGAFTPRKPLKNPLWSEHQFLSGEWDGDGRGSQHREGFLTR